MHEFSIAQAIAEIIEEKSKEYPGKNLTRIHLRIGRYRAIVKDSLEFGLGVVLENTPAASAAIEIDFVPIAVSCASCGAEEDLEEPFLICPKCGGLDVTVIRGKELEIDLLEFS